MPLYFRIDLRQITRYCVFPVNLKRYFILEKIFSINIVETVQAEIELMNF